MVSCQTFGFDETLISCYLRKTLQHYKNIFIYIFLRVNFFCSKRMKTVKQKSPTCFDNVPLNSAYSVFTLRQCQPFPFGIIKRTIIIKRMICFSRFKLCFDIQIYIHLFNI